MFRKKKNEIMKTFEFSTFFPKSFAERLFELCRYNDSEVIKYSKKDNIITIELEVKNEKRAQL